MLAFVLSDPFVHAATSVLLTLLIGVACPPIWEGGRASIALRAAHRTLPMAAALARLRARRFDLERGRNSNRLGGIDGEAGLACTSI